MATAAEQLRINETEIEMALRFGESQPQTFTIYSHFTVYIMLIASKSMEVVEDAIKASDGEELMAPCLELKSVCRNIARLNGPAADIPANTWLATKGLLVKPVKLSEELIGDNGKKIVKIWICRLVLAGAALGAYTALVYFDDDKDEPKDKWFSTLAKVGFAMPISSLWKACDESLAKVIACAKGRTKTTRRILKVSKFLEVAIDGIIKQFNITPVSNEGANAMKSKEKSWTLFA